MKNKRQSEVFVVFKTDAHMSVCSYILMGVFGTLDKAVHAVMTRGKFDTDWMEEQDSDVYEYIRDYLKEHMQTPLTGEINYVVKEGNLNEWEELL